MGLELTLLAWSVLLLFVYIGVQSTLMTKHMGSDYNAGPRDQAVELGVHGGRADRALRNFLETYPAFIALALIVAVTGLSGGLTQWGAILYFVGRIVYLPLYVFGVKYVRSLVYVVSVVGLLMMLLGLVI